MKDQKFDSVFKNEDSDTIAKELAGILVVSFVIALGIVITIFQFI